MHGPNSAEMLAQQKRLAANMKAITYKVLVMSGKGGVGKSSVSVNLASALAASGKQVGIVDTDIHGPNVAKMLGIEGKIMSRTDWGLSPVEAAVNLKAASMALTGSHPDQPLVWRGPMKAGAIQEFLGGVAWGPLDYLVVDSPPGTGDEPMSVCQLIRNVTGAVIVTTPQEMSILDSRKSVFFARQMRVPVIGIIENMSGMECPHCRGEIEIFKKGGGEKAAQELGVPFLGRIPFDLAVVGLADSGRPFIVASPQSAVGTSFQVIVKNIVKACESGTLRA